MIRFTRFACGRFTSLSLSFAILFSLALVLDRSPANARSVGVGEEMSSPESVRIIQSDRDGVVFEVTPPALERLPAPAAHDGSVILRMEGYGHTAIPGLPGVPQTAFAIGLPPDATPTLEILSTDTYSLPVGRVAPTPRRELVNFDGILHPDFVPQFAHRYEPDALAYSSDRLYPPAPVVLDDITWLRDQRIVRIRVMPAQVNPMRQEVNVQGRLRIRVSFDYAQGSSVTVTSRPESAAYERVLENTLLNYEEARAWRQTPPLLVDVPPASPCQATNVLRSNGYRIALEETGMYALSYDQLAAAGLSGTVPSAKIRMCHLEDEIAIDVADGGDGIFGSGDRVIFYGESIKTRETSTNVYWFTYDGNGTNGSRMEVMSGSGVGTTPPGYAHHIHLEVDQRYYSLFPDDEDYSFDHWYWEQLSYGVQGGIPSLTAPFTSSHKAAGEVTVRGEFLGGLAVAPHAFEVRLNGTRVGDIVNFAGSGRNTVYAFSGNINSSFLENGANELEVVALNSGDPNGHSFVVNWLELTAPRQFIAVNDRIAFAQPAPGQWRFVVTGFSGSAAAYDVTDGHAPAKITPTSGSGTVSFARTTDAVTSYEMVGSGAYLAPLSITKDNASNLRSSSHQATFLIITDPALNAALTPLKQWRQNNGFSVMTVFVQDIFDEFGYGLYSTEAIRAFLAYTYANWASPAPSYVLLAGEGSYDHRNLLGENGPGDDRVPVYLRPGVDVMLGEAAADNQYVAFLGGDMAQMMLGRLPAATSAEMSLLVNKILEYESAPFQVDWNARNLFVVDNYYTPPACSPDGAGDFFATTNRFLRDYVTPARQIMSRVYYAPQPCYPNENYPVYEPYYHDTLDIQSAVAIAFRQGHHFVIYSGHSAISHWGRASESFLTAAAIPSLDNADRLSIMLPLTCLEGITHYPTAPGISERLLRSAVGGAVASYAPTGLQVQTAHEYLVEGFYDAIFLHGAQTIGEGVIGAKVNLANNGPGAYQDLQDTYGLLGDPALRLHIWHATDVLSLPMISISGN